MNASQTLRWTPVLALLAVGCGGSNNNSNAATGLASYVSRLSNADSTSTATLRSGRPAAGNGPAVTLGGTDAATIAGGSRQLTVTSDASSRRLRSRWRVSTATTSLPAFLPGRPR